MTQPFDESKYTYLPGERGWIWPTMLGVSVALLGATVVILSSENDGGIVALAVLMNLALFGVTGREFLKRRAFLRDRRNGKPIERTPGRPTGHGSHEGPNLAE